MNAIGVKFYILFSLVVVTSCSQESHSSEISNASKNLAYCDAVYAYSANLAQMLDNEGLAKSYLARMSNVITANFFLNLENNKVAGDKIRQFKLAKKGLKATFDKNPKEVFDRAQKCDESTREVVSYARRLDVKFDGKNFLQFQATMLRTLLASLGIPH